MVKAVEVFPPGSDKGELHTIPNARDLVLHAGWGYRPGKVTLPVEAQPYRSPAPAGSNPSKAQEILDSAGMQTERAAPREEAFVPHEEPVKVVEIAAPRPAPTPPEDEAGAEEGVSADDLEAEAEAEAAEKAAGRTRKPRAPKPAADEEI